ncbi:MAG: hypothetical protein ACPGED_10875, partial [Flavobacteriales bacterium]
SERLMPSLKNSVMNKQQEQRLKMYQSVMNVIRQHSEAFKNVKAFNEYSEQFSTLLNTLHETAIQQEELNRAKSGQPERWDELASRAQELCAALFSIGRENKDHSLMGTVNCSFSDLRHCKANEAARIYNFIVSVAQNHKTQLKQYGWGEERITEFDKDAFEFLDFTGESRTMVLSRKANTRKLADVINDMKDLLDDHIDAIAIQLRTSNPEVFDKYTDARRIIPAPNSNRTEESKDPPEKDVGGDDDQPSGFDFSNED